MEIFKEGSNIVFKINNLNFVFDPPQIREKEGYVYILTDFSRNKNIDRIFNFPGEYNVDNVFIYAFKDDKFISFLFKFEENWLYYLKSFPSEETLKKIKNLTKEIDIIFLGEKLAIEKIINHFHPKVIISLFDLNLPKFQKNKNSKFKINNIKRSENQLLIIQ